MTETAIRGTIMTISQNGSVSSGTSDVNGSVAIATTGSGSVMAQLISQGAGISRHTDQGSIKPFGLDVGTADDVTVVWNSSLAISTR